MKIKIRQNIFETNSSSTHTLTMCSKENFEKFKNQELYFSCWDENFFTKEELIEKYYEEYISSLYKTEYASDEGFMEFLLDYYEICSFPKLMEYKSHLEYYKKERTIDGVNVVSFGFDGWE